MTPILQIPSTLLFHLDRFKESPEVAFAKALRAMALDDFNEHRRAILNRTGKDLQEITLIIPIYKNALIMDFFHIFLDTAHAVREHLIIGIGHTQEFYAALA